ncbi:hypothetical protein FRB93_000494 [Tulasnella sp. JGI-2019a]|nr:hypothetical protein FRB93_000494 [Tulasnella sp. JGI-2019a]
MRIFSFAAISTAFCITNTLANPPVLDRAPSMGYSTLLDLIKSQDEAVKLRAARSGIHFIWRWSPPKLSARSVREIECDQDIRGGAFDGHGGRNIGMVQVRSEIWLLYRFMTTPKERCAYDGTRYHLNSYWTSRIFLKPEIPDAVTNSILGMDLKWDQLEHILFGPGAQHSPANSWVNIRRKKVKVGATRRLQSLPNMNSEDRDYIKMRTILAIRSGFLGFTLYQAGELSKVFAGCLDGFYLPGSAPSRLESISDTIVPRYSAIPADFGFNQLSWDQKVGLRQLDLVVETHWDALKRMVIDPGSI